MEHCDEPTEPPQLLEPGDYYDQTKYWDEMTGVPLPTEAVEAARQEEMDYYKQMDAYDEVEVKQFKAETGKEPLSCRSKEIKTGDATTIEVRSRLIAREMKVKATDGHFAGTPPLGLVRFAVSRVATGTSTGGQRMQHVLDAKRALLHADALRATYVMPPHLRKTGWCWRIKKCMYGTVPAAAGWQTKVASVYEAMGMARCKTTPCAFLPQNAGRGVSGARRRLHHGRAPRRISIGSRRIWRSTWRSSARRA